MPSSPITLLTAPDSIKARQKIDTDNERDSMAGETCQGSWNAIRLSIHTHSYTVTLKTFLNNNNNSNETATKTTITKSNTAKKKLGIKH